jgi:hypothetical protein
VHQVALGGRLARRARGARRTTRAADAPEAGPARLRRAARCALVAVLRARPVEAPHPGLAVGVDTARRAGESRLGARAAQGVGRNPATRAVALRVGAARRAVGEHAGQRLTRRRILSRQQVGARHLRDDLGTRLGLGGRRARAVRAEHRKELLLQPLLARTDVAEADRQVGRRAVLSALAVRVRGVARGLVGADAAAAPPLSVPPSPFSAAGLPPHPSATSARKAGMIAVRFMRAPSSTGCARRDPRHDAQIRASCESPVTSAPRTARMSKTWPGLAAHAIAEVR